MPSEQPVAVVALDFGLPQQAQAEGRPHKWPRVDFVVALGDRWHARVRSRDFRESEAVTSDTMAGVVGPQTGDSPRDAHSVSAVLC